MAEQKTLPTAESVKQFIESQENEKKRQEAYILLDLMKKVTGEEAKMWGSSIIGFGSYHYKYESGHEGDSLRVGFSSRKAKHSIYIMPGFDNYDYLMKKLGKFKTGKSCLYVNKLEDIDLEVLKDLIKESYLHIKEIYPD